MRKSEDSMEERLRAERTVHSAPVGFTGRVMSRLPAKSETSNVSAQPAVSVSWPGFALGFALLVIAAVLAFEFLNPPSPPEIASNVSQPVVEPISSETVTLPFSRITAEQVQALTVKLDQPLEKELENVISDTRQAIQFVASNFLPEK